MAQPIESSEHKEWRLAQASEALRQGRIEYVAEQMLIENPELTPVECVKLARELANELRQGVWPADPEPPFSDVPQARALPEGWPAPLDERDEFGELRPDVIPPDEPATRTNTGFSFAPVPSEQGRVGGFWPQANKPA